MSAFELDHELLCRIGFIISILTYDNFSNRMQQNQGMVIKPRYVNAPRKEIIATQLKEPVVIFKEIERDYFSIK